MSRHEKYADYDVEIDDYLIDFNRLRKTTLNQVRSAYPDLGAITRENYEAVLEKKFQEVLSMSVNILNNNNIIDYGTDRLDGIMRKKFFSSFGSTEKKFRKQLNACNEELRLRQQRIQQNKQNSGNSYDFRENTAAANLLFIAGTAAAAYGQNVHDNNKRDEIFNSYKLEYKVAYENNVGYVCEVIVSIMAEKFLDEEYINRLNADTENILKKLDDFMSNDDDEDVNFDKLFAEALSVNSISHSVYHKIFMVGVTYINIDPFEIKKIADIHDIDISNLIIEYFTAIVECGEEELSERIEHLDSVIEEYDAYTPEQSGQYADYLVNLKSYVLSVRKYVQLYAGIPECKDESEMLEVISEIRKITFSNVKNITETDNLTKRINESLDDFREDFMLRMSEENSNSVTEIMKVIDENKTDYSTEFAVKISSYIDAVPDKTDFQLEFYTAYKNWIAKKIEEDLKKRLKSMSHNDMVADRDSYYNGTNDFYNLVQNDIVKENYETTLINTINDFENREMFRMCLGLDDMNDIEELVQLREKIVGKNYSDSITATYTKKIDDKLIEIKKADIIKELSEKISSLDYQTAHAEWVNSTSGNSSIYTPDIYVSAEEITALLENIVDKYENAFLTDMCKGIDSADLDTAYTIHRNVCESPYRDCNKSSFISNIENRIDILRVEEIDRICANIEYMNEQQLVNVASMLINLSYQHKHKDESIIKINTFIRNCRINNYVSFLNSINKSKFVGYEQSKSYFDFEQEVIKQIDVPVGRDNETFSMNINNNTLWSLELALGYMPTEAMLGLISAVYVFLQNRFYAPKFGFILYENITSVTPVKGLFKSQVDIRLNNGTVISVKVPKNECDAVAGVFSSFMQLR